MITQHRMGSLGKTMTLKIGKSNHIPAFLAMQVMQSAQQRETEGHDIVHLEVGQPSTPPPRRVCTALSAALDNTAAHGYSVALGQPALRQRIAAHYADWYGLTADWRHIAITPGSSLGFAIAFLAAFDAGDHIAIATPGYPAYRNLMVALGLVPDLVPARAAQAWMPDLQALEKAGTIPDGLLLASPANPTGVVISDDELAQICAWCDKHGVRLIMDEIYHGLTYGGRGASALKFSQTAIIINSFSKYFCMTGWRLGWMVLPDDLVDNAEKLSQNLFISAPTINQMGAVAAFDCYDELDAHVPRYQNNRDKLYAGLPAAFLGQHAPADGAFYLYADISALGIGALDFAQRLLCEAGVAVTPGVDFDAAQGQQFVRLSYAGSETDISRAIDRINRWLASAT
jgi:aspartate/methionine/tyrosine aminotransferase